jgi:hypothetical protein
LTPGATPGHDPGAGETTGSSSGEAVMHKNSARTILIYAALILASIASAGCQKLSNVNTPKATTIPATFGELVAVTPGSSQSQSVLWFKQPDQTIVAVRVLVPSGRIEAATTKFPRS